MDRMPLSGCRMRPFLFHVISFYLVVDYDDLGGSGGVHFSPFSRSFKLTVTA